MTAPLAQRIKHPHQQPIKTLRCVCRHMSASHSHWVDGRFAYGGCLICGCAEWIEGPCPTCEKLRED